MRAFHFTKKSAYIYVFKASSQMIHRIFEFSERIALEKISFRNSMASVSKMYASCT